MKKNRINLLLLVGTLMVVSCTAAKVFSEPPLLAKEQVWQLVKDGNPQPVTIAFNPATGNLSGRMACNTYSASYSIKSSVTSDTLDWSALEISHIEHSDVQCPEAKMNAENRYLAMLKKSTQIACPYPHTTLILGNRNKPLLIFELQ